MEDEWQLPTECSEASRQLAERLIETGWRSSNDKKKISHPTKPELNVAFDDPPFDDFMLSPRLAEFLMEHKKPWVKILLDALSSGKPT